MKRKSSHENNCKQGDIATLVDTVPHPNSLTQRLEYLLIVTMTHLTIHNLDENIKYRLQKQAQKHGRSLEEEAKEILRLTLTKQESPSNIVTMIERRFAHCGEFELPEIPREPIRQIPTLEE